MTPQRMTRPTVEVADILRAQGDRFLDRYRSSFDFQQLKAFRAIERCRRAALGGHRDACPSCGYQAISYNSCRNRHCPKCDVGSGSTRASCRPVPFAEFFYVLDGTISFGRVNKEGALEWLTCQAGESVLAPANAPHATQNQSDHSARFLPVANFHHEFILVNGGRFVEKDDPLPTHPNAKDFQRFDELARKYGGYRVELESRKEERLIATR
jgi:hypothetical protein